MRICCATASAERVRRATYALGYSHCVVPLRHNGLQPNFILFMCVQSLDDPVTQEASTTQLRAPHAGATPDHAAVVVGAVLALLLSTVEACATPRLAQALDKQAALLQQLRPWFKCGKRHPVAVTHMCHASRLHTCKD